MTIKIRFLKRNSCIIFFDKILCVYSNTQLNIEKTDGKITKVFLEIEPVGEHVDKPLNKKFRIYKTYIRNHEKILSTSYNTNYIKQERKPYRWSRTWYRYCPTAR